VKMLSAVRNSLRNPVSKTPSGGDKLCPDRWRGTSFGHYQRSLSAVGTI